MGAYGEQLEAGPYVWQPQSLLGAWQLKTGFGESAAYAAGSTYMRTLWESDIISPPRHLIDLGKAPGLHGIQRHTHGLRIGAMTLLSECQHSSELAGAYPALIEAIRGLAAPSIRNLATIGGNVLSRVGDVLPALLIYHAQLVWFNGEAQHTEALSTWLTSPRKRDSDESRILVEIMLPLQAEDQLHVYHKVGRRAAFIPAVVSVAMTGRIRQDRLYGFRIAAGGSGLVPRRLTAAETSLSSASLDESILRAVLDAVYRQYEAYDDAFTSLHYKKQTAANLIVSELWKRMSRL